MARVPQMAREAPAIPAARVILAVLTVVSTILATWLFCQNVTADGLSLFDVPLIALFGLLFLWISMSFWVATMGLAALLLSRPKESAAVDSPSLRLPSRSAILVPIYNEDPQAVFASVRAMMKSLQATGAQANFDFFILSDTTNPDLWLEEERCWARLARELPAHASVFYRHRPKNTSRKAGNIADFCCRWGEHYQYMIVLDADSVMEGATLVEIARRMDADPQIGILQVPPTPVNRLSLFARMQQFAARVYGPVFLEGLAQWSQCDGNYWGHNAIIRIAPFMAHSDLPILPGSGPLGGEILSHDFVEAALMRRAGWKVCLAHDLGGSYEECPTTMRAFAQRDQRWCQGNMQHLRLLLADGLHPASRMHLGMGVMSYVASPLWLCFLLLTLLAATAGEGWFTSDSATPHGLSLFAATMAMLLLPKLWGLIALPLQAQGVAGHGGWGGALASALLETVVSIFTAPIMMLLHTVFVVSTFSGYKVSWDAQQRDDCGVSLSEAWAVHWRHMLFGLGATTIVALSAPQMLLWLSPVLLGLVFSIPLSMLIGSREVGARLARRGLLLIPEEIDPPNVLRWQRAGQQRAAGGVSPARQPFAEVLHDPAFYALHRGILRATQSGVPMPRELLLQAVHAIQEQGPEAVPIEHRRAALNDAEAMEKLHILTRSQLPRHRSTLA